MTHNSSDPEDDDDVINGNNNKEETEDDSMGLVNIPTTINVSSSSQPPPTVLPHKNHTDEDVDSLYALSPSKSHIADFATPHATSTISNQQRSAVLEEEAVVVVPAHDPNHPS